MWTRYGLSVNSSQIVGDWCHQGCPWQNLKLNLLNIVRKLIYQWLKKYFYNPFKDKHSHLPYGDLNGPPGRILHIYLPIIQELIYSLDPFCLVRTPITISVMSSDPKEMYVGSILIFIVWSLLLIFVRLDVYLYPSLIKG